jgi:flagellar hook-basal body complex protein FliE
MDIDIAVPRIFDSAFIPDIPTAPIDTTPRRQHEIGDAQRSNFESFFQSALAVINETNLRQVESDVAQVNLATGRTNDVLEVVLAQSRADSALNFTVQITNRIVEAYREIMRMQV